MLTPKKSLGQNFLRDPNIARKIVASLRAAPGAPVVEIGPGTGALTALLDERFERVTAIEIDSRAVQLLKPAFPRVEILQDDILEVDWNRLAKEAGGKLHVIGNLPYSITSQILFGLIDARESVGEAVLMMQYEVAQRLVARPSTKAYGILSVAVQLVSRPQILFPVSRNVFYPKPNVRSAVVRLEFMDESMIPPEMNPAWVRRVVRTAFNQRRKTLRNSLRELALSSEVTLEEFISRRRAEELTPEDFVHLARYLQSGS